MITEKKPTATETLQHFGKRGMHWGQRHSEASTGRKVAATVAGWVTMGAANRVSHNPVVAVAAGVTVATLIMKSKGRAPVSSLK